MQKKSRLWSERVHLWYNGRFWLDSSGYCDAVLTRGERIYALGTEEEMRALRTRDFGETILEQRSAAERSPDMDNISYGMEEGQSDLHSAYVYPGFRDPHAHLLYLGLGMQQADLNACSGPEEVLERLLAHAGSSGSNGEWLIGRDWNDSAWPAGAILDRHVLDSAFPDRPVYVGRVDRHAAVVNSAALKMAGVHRARPIKGGMIEERNGLPSGLLIDEAMNLVRVLMPEAGPEQEREALLLAQKLCFSQGLVGVADMGLNLDQYKVLLAAQDEGSLKMPIYGTLTPDEATQTHYRREGPYQGDRLSLRAFKYYADGALGSRGARLLQPYSDMPDAEGLWMHDPDYLHAQARLNADQGFQTVTHAIGDAAVRLVLDVLQRAAPPGDHRWRVEHAQIVHPDDVPRFAQLGAWASVQACHGVSDRAMALQRLGSERLTYAYRARSLLDAGARFVNGTDFPIEPISPLRSFAAACLRAELSSFVSGEGLGVRSSDAQHQNAFRPEEALSRLEALLAMTAWTAEAQFQEDECGQIKPGQFADFSALDRDLLHAKPAELAQARVTRTVVRAEEVFAEGSD